MKKNLLRPFFGLLFLGFAFSTQAQLTCSQSASTSGTDCTNPTATITPPCGFGNVSAVTMNAGSGFTTWCPNWYDYDLIIDGATVVTGLCSETGYNLMAYWPFTTIAVAAQDNDGFCDFVTMNLTINMTYLPLLTAIIDDTIPVPCFGDTTANLVPVVVGGTGPYTLAWSTGSVDTALYNLGAGSYSVTVTDAVGDMDTAYIEVTQPDAIVTSTTVIQDLICDYDVGIGSVSASGGTAIPESYVWDTAAVNFSPDTSMVGTPLTLGDDQTSGLLNIGFDFVFFGDTHSTFSISSNGFIALDGPSTPNGCCSGQNIPNASTPNNLISVVWDDLWGTNGGGMINYYTIGTAPFRTLIVNFTDVSYCCSATQSVTAQAKLFETTNCIEIHTVDVINANPATQGIENQNGTEAYTYPGRNQSSWSSVGTFISFCAPVGGLSYEWNNGGTDTLNLALAIGDNTVTVTDGNGCQASDTITINPPISQLALDPDVIDISCFGFNDGSIVSNETGGVSPVSYGWNSGQTSANISGLLAGTYSVTATDAVGCIDSVGSMTIVEPAILLGNVYDVQNTICSNDENGAASIIVSGGIPPYSPVWSNGEIAYTATNLPAGNNYVVVTDANGCEVFFSVNVLSEFDSPTPYIGNNLISANGAGVTLNTNPSTYSSYLWNTGATSASLLAANTGYYWVEVTNSAGCVGSDTAYVEVWPTGINDIVDNAKFALYPNPATTNLMMLLDANTNLTNVNVSITNIHGQTVLSQSFNSISASEQVELDVKDIATGIYNLSVQSDEYSAVKNFVKQ
ncbi:T9SS type A sorting domain-containing protein [Salibacteraceae bacterium]|nr:T9SS type A sorting domain-containing protein [Salibacteraceae bacterium]MDB9708858.1 T9SS type A sorting domain-containing protein [Salibacteraceae bacterium]MDC1304664.1 T9SS type A sorting domain-containing protein [Salibacteraceae bacterium]